MKKNKFQRLMIAEAIALNQRVLDLETQLRNEVLNSKVNLSDNHFVKEGDGTISKSPIRDSDGIPVGIPITNPESIPLSERPKERELRLYLPRRLNADHFIATKADLDAIGIVGILYEAIELTPSRGQRVFKTRFIATVTNKSPRYVHMFINNLFEGRYSFVMEVRYV